MTVYDFLLLIAVIYLLGVNWRLRREQRNNRVYLSAVSDRLEKLLDVYSRDLSYRCDELDHHGEERNHDV